VRHGSNLIDMLFATLLLILIELAVAVMEPVGFILVSLWVQTLPYTWNWDTQLVYDTPVGPLNVVAMQLFGFCLACLVIVGSKFEAVITQFRVYRWHCLFIGFAALSMIYAPSGAFAFRMVAKLLGPLLFLMVVMSSITSLVELRKICKAVIGSGLILLGLALYARAMGLDSDPNALQTGVAGLGPPSMGPPVFAAHMLPVSMLAFSTFIVGRSTVMLVVSLACAAAVLAALQRTSAAALYLGFSVILLFGTRGIWRLLLPSIGVIGLPILIVFNETFRRRMFFGQNDSEELLDDPTRALTKINTSGRSGLWSNMLDRFFQPHPIFGSGIGSTQDYLYSRASGASGVAHSEYVRLLCEVGLLGLLLFVMMAAGYLAMLRSLTFRTHGELQRTLALAAIGSVVAYLVYCSTDNAFDYVTQFGIYVFGLVGASLKARQLAPFEQRSRELAVPQRNLFPNLLR
jgi:hypothetical protein